MELDEIVANPITTVVKASTICARKTGLRPN